jgi:ABC-type sugar transport system substrate-binding protein
MTPSRACGLLIGLVLPLCAATASEAKAGDKQLTIGFALAEYQHWKFAEMKSAAEVEADALGVKLKTMDAHYLSMNQPDHVDVLVDERVDGILVNPVPAAPSALLGPAIDAAAEAGVPVVKVLADSGPDKALALVATDAALGAHLAARFVIDKLGGKGSVLFLEGYSLAAATAAFEKELQGSDVKILARVRPGHPTRSEAKRVMAQLIREHPQFDAVLGMNDNVVLGAIDAMVEAGIDPSRKATITWIASPDTRRAIEAGQLGAALDLRPREQAVQALRILVEYLRTKKVPASKEILVAPKLITKASPEG